MHLPCPADRFLHRAVFLTIFAALINTLYTCQLSRIMRESHACGLKTAISRFKDNFSCLTHKSRRIVLKTLQLISDLLCIISLLFIIIAKVFKCLQSVHFCKCSKVVETSSDILGNIWKSSENRRNLQKWLGRFRKSRS